MTMMNTKYIIIIYISLYYPDVLLMQKAQPTLTMEK